MRILVVGSGGVGAAFAPIAARREFYERIVFADHHEDRGRSVVERYDKGTGRFSAATVDASDPTAIADLVVKGYDFAPSFSIWTTIEECLNPPIVWEKESGWYTLPPFSEPETFTFPQGIGPLECVHVEHEEVLLIPRWIDCGRVTFKYGLGDEFIDVLKTLHKLGLDATGAFDVRGRIVSPC